MAYPKFWMNDNLVFMSLLFISGLKMASIYSTMVGWVDTCISQKSGFSSNLNETLKNSTLKMHTTIQNEQFVI